AVTMSIETENSENVTLTILNSLGQSVKAAETRSVQKGKTDLQIDVSQLRSGIYFIQVQSSKGMVSKKFIKQ
ncbi:MAG: hypothetical protein JWP12_2975, partial [Bacteroidetes bacterium]|nr:hypothetical protein [Bacteroidota bacterium]